MHGWSKILGADVNRRAQRRDCNCRIARRPWDTGRCQGRPAVIRTEDLVNMAQTGTSRL
jgi:hypothetical protein